MKEMATLEKNVEFATALGGMLTNIVREVVREELRFQMDENMKKKTMTKKKTTTKRAPKKKATKRAPKKKAAKKAAKKAPKKKAAKKAPKKKATKKAPKKEQAPKKKASTGSQESYLDKAEPKVAAFLKKRCKKAPTEIPETALAVQGICCSMPEIQEHMKIAKDDASGQQQLRRVLARLKDLSRAKPLIGQVGETRGRVYYLLSPKLTKTLRGRRKGH